MKKGQATFIGCIAIIMWGIMPLLNTYIPSIPPFQAVCIAFGINALLTLIKWILFKQPIKHYILIDKKALMVGIYGIFGFNLLYFMALKEAPPIEVALITALWPLLLVLFSSFLPGESLKWYHVTGGVLGFSGVVSLITQGSSLSFNSQYWFGYLLAFLCAFIWSSYSIFNQKFEHLPTDTVGTICAATFVLALISHLICEVTIFPSLFEWLILIILGIGPIGSAFYFWDYAIKHGNIKLLGSLSFCIPLITTTSLILFGKGTFSINLVISCILIFSGLILSSSDRLKQKRSVP